MTVKQISNQPINRTFRSFKLKFLPHFQKIFLFFFFFLIISFIGLKLFKPQILTKINEKISLYFLHNLNLDNYDFQEIKISGNKRVSDDEIRAAFAKIKNQGISLQILTKNLQQQLPWIKQINATRTLPNSLNLAITEYDPFAIWQNGGQKFVIDKEGNKIKIDNDNTEFNNLMILSGANANLHARSLFNLLVINPEFGTKIYSATWVGNRRWDLRLENGVLAKLAANNLQESWQNLIKIYNLQGATKNLQIVDLRIEKKIYLKYSDNEIMNFKL